MKFSAINISRINAASPACLQTNILLVVLLVLLTGTTYASETVRTNDDSAWQSMSVKYRQLKQTLLDSQRENNFHTPLYIQSNIAEGKATGHVYAILPHAFTTTSETFGSVSSWCYAAALHVNVKTCTTRKAPGQSQVSLYVGEKDYQEPEDAYQIDYQYRNIARSDNYLHTVLGAKSGPLDSSDYLIDIEAIPLDNSNTFIHFSYSARYGFLSNLLMQTYLATAGRNKVGFTRRGTDENGNIIFINGLKGVIERNAMRYFLALESFLETSTLPGNNRLEASLNKWYEFTEKYSRQLHELNREEYLTNKLREHENQIALQHAINNAGATTTETSQAF